MLYTWNIYRPDDALSGYYNNNFIVQCAKSMSTKTTGFFRLINRTFTSTAPTQSNGISFGIIISKLVRYLQAYCAIQKSLISELTPEQLEIQKLAKRFTIEEIIPAAPHHDKTGVYPFDIIKKVHSLGLLNLHLAEEFGYTKIIIHAI